jgi:hypothetical protein
MTSPEPLRRDWAEIAAAQEQVLGRQQALGAGLTPDAWDYRLGRGWQSIGPGVTVLHTGEPTDAQLRWAAVLHMGERSALTGDAALVAYGVKRLTFTVHDVAVPAGAGLGWVRHKEITVRPWQLSRIEELTSPRPGVPVLKLEVALLHAAARAPSDREAERRVAMVVQQRLTTPGRIRTELEQMPRLRRRRLICVVLDDVEFGAHAESELEFLRFCRRNGIPEPDEMQVKVRANGTKYLDARYRKQRVSVEVDGAHHMWVEQWDADALRTLELAAETRGTDELLVRLTSGNMRHSEPEVATALRSLLLGGSSGDRPYATAGDPLMFTGPP